MAAYCTQTDLERRFGPDELAKLTDETSASDIDPTEVDDACTYATSIVDAYLSPRFTLPLVSVPSVVKGWAEDIARRRLWKDNAGPESAVQRNYDEALRMLRDVAAGRAGLPDASGVAAVESSTGGVAVCAPSAVFTSDALFDYMP